MEKKKLIGISVGIIVIVVVIAAISFVLPRVQPPAGPTMKDTDGDGVPDDQDDYPHDKMYRARLEVTKSNWFRKDNEVHVVFEYRNNKSYDLYFVTPYVSIIRSDGVVIKTYDSAWGAIDSGNVFQPGEKSYSWVLFEDPEKLAASYMIEVKGESLRGYEPKEFKDPNVNIESHGGSYNASTNTYTISGTVKNNENVSVNINIYAGFLATNGTLLDVGKSYSIYIPAGRTAMFSITSHEFPDADKISTYEMILLRC
ncbi:MAG: hypothetical protein QMD21_01845 [Candidatus Thermoplasmatota archaeon]|nr:hypothetical protein [Candidatus Thermoplasmatota archaeon]